MTGVIRLSGPVPSADTDDLRNISDTDNDSPREEHLQLGEPSKSLSKQNKNKQKWSRVPTKSFRSLKNLKSKSVETDDGDPDKDTDTKSSHSHHRESAHSPEFHGLRACYPYSTYIADYKCVIKEIISGIIVSFAQVPEAISFAMLANVPPIFGLHSAWMIGGIVALTGGRPGMISSATGGMGAILGPIMTDLGLEYLPYILIFSGLLVLILGICGIGKFARLIPQTVMIGFLNGLAIIILKSQFHLFDHAHNWIDIVSAASLAIITFCVVQFLPKLTKLIPSSLAGIGIASLIEYLIIRMAIGHHTPLIGDLHPISGSGSYPVPFWNKLNNKYYTFIPPLNSTETWSKLVIPIILVTLVSIIEDAMTMDVVTELTHTKSKHLERHTKQQEISMGFANIISGLFPTMGGHGAIGLSMVSCHSGSSGVYRIGGIAACCMCLIIVLLASAAIDAIPGAALVGIMLAVVFHTFEWRSIPMIISSFVPRRIRKKLPKCMRQTKIRRGDAIVILLVTIIVIIMNLVYAVLLGIIISCLIYTWYSGFDFNVHKEWVHKHHMRDRRQIGKFSDFHIHYKRNNHLSHSAYSRENSVETIHSMDPHYHGHDGYHHIEHNHGHHNDSYASLDRVGSFSKDNKFTELHEIRDIHHLDTFMNDAHHHESHMEPLKEAVEPLKGIDINVVLKDIDKIKDIHDTYNSKTSDNTKDHKKIPIFPTAATNHIDIEHGTFNKLETFDCKLSDDDGKLSDDDGMGKLSDVTNTDDIGIKFNNDYILVYHFEGPLFFGNCRNLLDHFTPKTDPEQIEIHLRDAHIYDFSAMDALNQIGEEYDKLNKTVHLRHINTKSHKLIAKAHHLVKYFSYDDVTAAMPIKNNNNQNNKEREISKSKSLLQLTTPNQYRFRMNTRYV